MRRAFLAAVLATFAFGVAMAQDTCESKAVSKDGKPLAGAAKTSFLKKCKADACAGKAVSKDGKPLFGAVKKLAEITPSKCGIFLSQMTYRAREVQS
jgi:hypothetical protein